VASSSSVLREFSTAKANYFYQEYKPNTQYVLKLTSVIDSECSAWDTYIPQICNTQAVQILYALHILQYITDISVIYEQSYRLLTDININSSNSLVY
jgi:hypothetical protein